MADPREVVRVTRHPSPLWRRADELERINVKALRERFKVLMVEFQGATTRGLPASLEDFRANIGKLARTLPQAEAATRALTVSDEVLSGERVSDEGGLGLASGLVIALLAAQERRVMPVMSTAAAELWSANPDPPELAECSQCLFMVPATAARRDWNRRLAEPAEPLTDVCPQCGADMRERGAQS